MGLDTGLEILQKTRHATFKIGFKAWKRIEWMDING